MGRTGRMSSNRELSTLWTPALRIIYCTTLEVSFLNDLLFPRQLQRHHDPCQSRPDIPLTTQHPWVASYGKTFVEFTFEVSCNGCKLDTRGCVDGY
ncbi:hypothetical protein DPEC_G00008540 [Dallia pectoralis]|uniref:Uncharacterized protein n=1 Tax=Dallia pectoralis TaxID=75939 RepID=A0ACC2HL04_DALPE|nr:hypothetical protein DPEC_G00008540 [Dallia pectoralis]